MFQFTIVVNNVKNNDCTGHFVMVPLNLTCLQHSFFEHLFNLNCIGIDKMTLIIMIHDNTQTLQILKNDFFFRINMLKLLWR